MVEYEEKQKDSEHLIMKMEPEKFEKKDHIFMNFFAMYGKNFIDEKRSQGDDSHARGNPHQLQAQLRQQRGENKALSC